MPSYQLLKSQKEAINTKEHSMLAKEIMGDKLHKELVNKYKQKHLQNSQPSL